MIFEIYSILGIFVRDLTVKLSITFFLNIFVSVFAQSILNANHSAVDLALWVFGCHRMSLGQGAGFFG